MGCGSKDSESDFHRKLCFSSNIENIDQHNGSTSQILINSEKNHIVAKRDLASSFFKLHWAQSLSGEYISPKSHKQLVEVVCLPKIMIERFCLQEDYILK